MKFGLFSIAPWHESMTPEQVLHDSLERIELGDRLGLDEVWLGVHRFSRHGLLSGFFSYCGQVAARTQNVRIGTAVIVLPLHNPVLVAEEVAMLDVLSGGRMEVGVGSGRIGRINAFFSPYGGATLVFPSRVASHPAIYS